MVKVVLMRPFYLKKVIYSYMYIYLCAISVNLNVKGNAAMGIAFISPFDITYFNLITYLCKSVNV